MTQDELAARLLAMFIDELDDQVRVANEHLLLLERIPGDREQLRSLFRVMHTLKGAARSAGVQPLEGLCHRMESLLATARDGDRAFTRTELDTIFAGVDTLAAAAISLRNGRLMIDEDVTDVARRREPGAASHLELDGPEPDAELLATSSEIEALASPREAALRVSQDRVDALFASSNRLLIFAAQTGELQAKLEEVSDIATHAAEMWRRCRRELEPRGLTPASAASTSGTERDFVSLDDALELLRVETARVLDGVTQNSRYARRIARDVSLEVRELRMRPFADVLADLPRVARDVASSTGKSVRLETADEGVQADRVVLAQLHEALLHLVRNAVDHGIEPPDVRRARGKPDEGTIRICAGLIGDRIVVTVSDDGEGIDIGAVRQRLIARGERVPADDRSVARRLFGGGISTRPEATAISGRGVGLDAVRAVTDRVRGTLDVTWSPGGGTTFTIEAPLTLATVRAVLTRVGQLLVAIPSTYIDRLVRIAPDDLHVVDGRLTVQAADAPALVASLAVILGPPLVERPAEGVLWFALVRDGETRVALRVDELLEEIEVVVQPIRAHGRASVPHVSGSAMLASGTIALVLSVPAAVATAVGLPRSAASVPSRRAASERRRRLLVVDDSITTRTLEASLLEAAGYDVITAVDGADGWRVLQEQGADLVVTDVEMPRMDGIQLCESVRASTRFRALPVILVTALESPEDRSRGLEAGADAYLGKSSFEQEGLLRTVRDLLG